MITVSVKKKLFGADGDFLMETGVHIARGGITAIAGPSGSGKTTFLRMLAGLTAPDEGLIEVDGKVWFRGEAGRKPKSNLGPQERRVGIVFQGYALFPHMSVLGNLLYASPDRETAEKLLVMTGLQQLRDVKPRNLSGGQKQRVALARALMQRPGLLLLDEPLSALDERMKSILQDELLKVHRELGVTMLIVTHDSSEIYKLCDRVLLFEKGRISADKSPRELFVEGTTTQKFAFKGEILDIKAVDAIHVAVVAIGNNLVEVVVDAEEKASLKPGDSVVIGTKAFNPTVRKFDRRDFDFSRL
ncbi:molybdenum ABC transporter ATP-binding protein [Prosthecochloris sp. GSB1]|uniref:sulfate/molybdate ABC transporter ATP-binding protein n=1 Tax=Prosthecochloris sp. GSB1 TaxID=281093 RepID=UPI000B8D0C13|nr:ATP-binding cassette domain-containing protein [Prosthecochloris sp. GSB1]ASQ89908.1 molybdenum ABC transporter ATP-binding protein [Prosthecochloris sp. GSB1]